MGNTFNRIYNLDNQNESVGWIRGLEEYSEGVEGVRPRLSEERDERVGGMRSRVSEEYGSDCGGIRLRVSEEYS